MSRLKSKGLWVGVLTLLVMGCSDQHSGLLQYIEQVKAIPASKIEALPELVVIESFEFDAGNVRDPFNPLEKMSAEMQGYDALSNAVHPDDSRLKGTMEFMPLDTLRMVGTVFFQLELWGLVEALNGKIYRVRAGDYMGLDHGEIVAIKDTSIELLERVSGSEPGVWVKRKAKLEILQ